MREVVGVSHQSFADAARKAVARASPGSADNTWFEVVELRGHVAGGEIREFQVKVKLAVPGE